MSGNDPSRTSSAVRDGAPHPDASDQQLIARFLDGDSSSFGTLVVRYQDRLINSLTRFLGSVDDATDVAQDAFVQAFEKLSGFRGDSQFFSWLYRIAINAAISRSRRRCASTSSLDIIKEHSGREVVDDNPSAAPSHGVEVEEKQRLVQQALSELPEDFRIVIVLKEIDGMKYDEIAEIVGIPIGTVRSRLHRARFELHQKLTAFFADDSD